MPFFIFLSGSFAVSIGKHFRSVIICCPIDLGIIWWAMFIFHVQALALGRQKKNTVVFRHWNQSTQLPSSDLLVSSRIILELYLVTKCKQSHNLVAIIFLILNHLCTFVIWSSQSLCIIFADKHQNTQCIYKSCHNSILMYNNVNVNLMQALLKIGG